MRVRPLLALTLLLLGLPAFLVAQAAAPEASPDESATHDELRALKAGLVDAVDKQDFRKLLTYLHPDVVVTWQNAEVCRGHAQVQAYLDRMTKGPESIVKSFKTNVTVDALTILHGGDTGISWGSSVDDFNLRNGQEFVINSRWSATLVKVEGKWLVGSFHASCNLFDNPLVAAAKKSLPWAAGGSLALGILIGVILGRRFRR